VLDKWHLPRSRTALQQLVAEAKSHSDPEAWLHGKMHDL
jgi:hypothetical protein